jgi:hypothetical protein
VQAVALTSLDEGRRSLVTRGKADDLESLPAIGPSLARDLRGARQDPCVLYAFRCAAYAARTPRPKAELLKWWNWKGRSL